MCFLWFFILVRSVEESSSKKRSREGDVGPPNTAVLPRKHESFSTADAGAQVSDQSSSRRLSNSMLAASEINADVQQLCFYNSLLVWACTKKHAGPRCRDGQGST